MSTVVLESDANPETSRAEVYALTKSGLDAAREIAEEKHLNNNRAELLLRNVAAIFNAPDAGPTAHLEVLSDAEVDGLQELAIRGFDFLGEKVKQKTRADLESGPQPATELEAKAMLMSRSFNLLQVAVGIGPHPERGGYDPAREDELRVLIVESAEVFGKTYQKFAEKGVPIAADPDRQRYFKTNIDNAAGSNNHSSARSHASGDPGEIGDWI